MNQYIDISKCTGISLLNDIRYSVLTIRRLKVGFEIVTNCQYRNSYVITNCVILMASNRSTSKVREYYKKKEAKTAESNLCSANVGTTGDTTNLMVHLQRHHKVDIKSSKKPVGNQVDGNSNHDNKAATSIRQVGGGDVEHSSGRFYYMYQ